MGFRFILSIVALVVVWQIIRHLLASRRPDTSAEKPASRKVITCNMVECHHCGLHLPENEAIVRNGKNYCSEQHANASDA